MRVVHVDAEAFGPLTGAQLDLAPGLTVVWGPNESGKSSWHAAIFAAVCGVRRAKGARRKAEQVFAKRHRPWDQPHWRVRAVAELADGRTLEFRQDLGSQVDCSVHDALLGTDLSDELMHDGSPDGATLFGLTRETLLPTACVRQADLLGVLDDPGVLQEHLQRAAATGGEDETAEQALSRLRAFLREHVGQDRRNATRPLRRAIGGLEAARAALDGARADHDAYLELTWRRDEARRAAGTAEAALQGARATMAERRWQRAEARLAEIRALSARLPEGCAEPAPDDDALAQQVAAALASWEHQPEEPAPLEGPSAAALTAELDWLPAVPEGDTEVAEEVAAARDAWRQAQHALTLAEAERSSPHLPLVEEASKLPGDVTPGVLRETAEHLETPIPSVDPALARPVGPAAGDRAGARTGLVAGAAVAAVVGIGLLLTDVTILGAVLLVTAAAAAIVAALRAPRQPQADPHAHTDLAVQRAAAAQARDRREGARRRAERWGVAADARMLRRLARSLEEREHVAAQRQRGEIDRARREAAADAAADRLLAVLVARGVPVHDDLETSFAAYAAACRQRTRDAGQAARAGDLRAQIASRRELEARAAAQHRQRQEAACQVRDAAQAAGLLAEGEGGDGESLAVGLRRWQAERLARRDAAHQQRADGQRLERLLGGATADEVAATVQRRRDEHATFAHVDPVSLPEDGDAAAAAVREFEGRLREAERKLATLEGQLADKAGGGASVAEAEEAVARAEEELARVRRLQETIETTAAFLETARDQVHRDIAPLLQRSVERRLPDITDGRYGEVRIDPASLEVQVRAAGGTSGAWRQAARLSHGTAEQIYLLLRVAMAEHLVTTGEPLPLLLDDPTVQADRQRTEAVLGLLHDLSADRQVVVFSQEEGVRAWASIHLAAPRDALIDLDPGAPERPPP